MENEQPKKTRKRKKQDPAEKLLDAFIEFRNSMDKNNPNHRAVYLGIMHTQLGPLSTHKMRKQK
jgi:hypothetical protein